MPGGWQFAIGHAPLFASPQNARRAGLTLLLITIVGAILRFYRLDDAALWGIEPAFNPQSYHELVGYLRGSSSAPLYDQIRWLISQLVPHPELALRAISAMAGTLMIPAMYFLARPFSSRNVALVVALFTCLSAFIFNQSHSSTRDMLVLLVCTLNALCLIRWLRTGGAIPWTSWLLTGVLMAGLHTATLVLPVIELLFLVTAARPHWFKAVLFLIGCSIISAGPVLYYHYFDPQPVPDGVLTPLQPTSVANDAHPAATLAHQLFNGRLPDPAAIEPAVAPGSDGSVIILGILAALLLLGALPWYRQERLTSGDPREKPWRVYAWLGAWIIIPLFTAWWLSTGNQTDPGQPIAWISHRLHPFIGPQPAWAWLLEGWAVVGMLCGFSAWVRRGLTVIVTFTLLIIFGGLVLQANGDVLSAGQRWIEIVTSRPIAWGLMIIVPVLLWAYSGDSTANRFAQTGRFIGVTIGLYLLCVLITLALADPSRPAWLVADLNVIWPAVTIATILLLCRLPGWPIRWLAILFLLAANVAQISARLYVTNDTPGDLSPVSAIESSSG